MAECFSCGISDQNAVLYDVITKEGIVKLCNKCARQEDSPVIRKPTDFQLKEVERKPSVYERLSKVAGLDPNRRRDEKSINLLKEETSLKAIVDKNYQEKIGQGAKPRPDLVDNFHWVIMRARRSKHITQKQMAEAIGEAEMAIKKAEEGFLPENNYLLNKIQNYLKINLFKDRDNSFQEKSPATNPEQSVNFDRKNQDVLTIADLKGIKETTEEKKRKELSDEEIHKLLFKK